LDLAERIEREQIAISGHDHIRVVVHRQLKEIYRTWDPGTQRSAR
jgi:hypothetical protein